MAAFSTYQQHSFLFDSVFHPNTLPVFSQFYPYESLGNNNNEVSEHNNHMNSREQSSSVADYMPEDGTNDQIVIMDKKRKNRDGNTSYVQVKDGKEMKGKRQRKRNGLVEDSEGTKAKSTKKDKKKTLEEAPSEFIHVRARRGQATDSHSLAERVRREKISERMKVLQTLVPGCDKVTGKAVMLDEIINYVQSLQHQVEFLSMKLASLNPTLYDFGMDLDTLMISPEKLNKLVSPILLSSLEKYNSALPAAFSEATTTSIYPQFFPQSQRTTAFISPDQENGQLLLDVDERRQRIANQFGSYQLHQLVGFPLM